MVLTVESCLGTIVRPAFQQSPFLNFLNFLLLLRLLLQPLDLSLVFPHQNFEKIVLLLTVLDFLDVVKDITLFRFILLNLFI